MQWLLYHVTRWLKLPVSEENHEEIRVSVTGGKIINTKMTNLEEDWFGQTNKFKYLELMDAMSDKECTTVKDMQWKPSGTGKWVDMKRFEEGNRLFNPNGIFKLHKNITLSDWIENMHKKTHGANITVYLLAHIYNKHVFHFSYSCKMRYPLNLVLENWKCLWFY